MARLREQPSTPVSWGPWVYDDVGAIVLLKNGRSSYTIDLNLCRTTGEVLDSCMQVAAKDWATDAILAGVLRAFRDLLEPQKTMCSWGERGVLLEPAEYAAARARGGGR
jgi:hypothetical protein